MVLSSSKRPLGPAPRTQSTTAQVSGTLTVLVPTGDPTLMPYIQLAANEFMKKSR